MSSELFGYFHGFYYLYMLYSISKERYRGKDIFAWLLSCAWRKDVEPDFILSQWKCGAHYGIYL